MGGDHGFMAAGEGVDVAVAHALGDFAGEGGTVATAAVHDDFGLGIWIEPFDIAFEDAAAEVLGFSGVAGLPFGVFPDIQKDGGRIGGEAAFRLFDGHFVDMGARGVDDFEETRRMLHGRGMLGTNDVGATENPGTTVLRSGVGSRMRIGR